MKYKKLKLKFKKLKSTFSKNGSWVNIFGMKYYFTTESEHFRVFVILAIIIILSLFIWFAKEWSLGLLLKDTISSAVSKIAHFFRNESS